MTKPARRVRHGIGGGSIRGTRVGTGLEQLENRVEAVGAHRPGQGRRSVDGARVDGCTLIEQPARGDPVAVLGGFDQRRRALRRGRSEARDEQRERS